MERISGSGGVRCGIIGEVGCSSPLFNMECKSLRASVAAQKMTGTLK